MTIETVKRHFPEVCHRCGIELGIICDVCTECLQWYCDQCIVAHYETIHIAQPEPEPTLLDRTLSLFDNMK